MTLLDLFADDAAAPLDLSSAPPDGRVAKLRDKAAELVECSRRLDRAEQLVADIRKRKVELETHTLPDMMAAAGVDTMGLAEAGVDIVASSFAHASIPVAMDPVKRDAAFAHLTELGGGDLIQATVSVAFPKEDIVLAERFRGAAQTWLAKASNHPPPVNLDQAVHHGTLSAWLRSQIETNAERIAYGLSVIPINLETLNGVVGRIVKIKVRKEKKIAKPRRKAA